MTAWDKIISDIKAVKKNNPAAKSYLEIILCHTPLWAIVAYRLMNPLLRFGVPIIPRFIMTILKVTTGIEIHPGTSIGKIFL